MTTSFAYDKLKTAFSLLIVISLFSCTQKTLRDYLSDGAYADSLNLYKQADLYFLKATEKFPDDKLPWMKRGDFYLKHQVFDSAEFCFTKVIQLAPDLAEAYYKRNLAMKWDEGPLPMEDLSKAIALKPDYGEAYKARAQRWLQLKKDSNAIKDFGKAIEFLKNDYDVFLERGKIYLSLHNYKKALSDFNEGIKIAPNDWDLYYNRGKCEYDLKMYEEAKKDFTSAINIYGDGEAYYSRARTEFRLGDLQSARIDKAKGISIDHYGEGQNDSIPYP